MARAKKVKCPACGAKNGADDRRCRVCTAIINTEVPEEAPEEPTPADAGAHEAAATAGIQLPGGGQPFRGGPKGPSKLSAALSDEDRAELDAARSAVAKSEAALPVYDETFVPIEIDETAAPRPPAPSDTPPPPISEETFDPNSFAFDRGEMARPRAAGAPPPVDPQAEAEAESFDLNGLDIDRSKMPRPSDVPAPTVDADAEAEAAAFRREGLDIGDPSDPRPTD